MRIWHDDIRPPPDGTWWWARTNLQAMELLERNAVDEISLDHDLGLEGIDPDADVETICFAVPSGTSDGYDLVDWMVKYEFVPPKVAIHSWNPAGAKRMAARLNEAGHDCIVAPFA